MTIPPYLNQLYVLVYKVRMKKMRIAHRVKAVHMARGSRKSHSICERERPPHSQNVIHSKNVILSAFA